MSMDIKIDGHRHEILIGTDVARPESKSGGAYIEMHALDTPGTNPFLFAYRSNETGKITISMYRPDVPLEALKYFLQVVEQEFAQWPLWKSPD
jgi:hypothetical protein